MRRLLYCAPILLPVTRNSHRRIDGIQHALLVCPALSRLAVGRAVVNRSADHRQADGAVDAAHGGVLFGDGVHSEAVKLQGNVPLVIPLRP